MTRAQMDETLRVAATCAALQQWEPCLEAFYRVWHRDHTYANEWVRANALFWNGDKRTQGTYWTWYDTHQIVHDTIGLRILREVKREQRSERKKRPGGRVGQNAAGTDQAGA